MTFSSNFIRTRQFAYFCLFLLLAGFAQFIAFQAGYRLLEKYAPDWSAIGLFRLGVGILAAFFLVAALRPFSQSRSVQGDLPVWLIATFWLASFFLLYGAMYAVIYWPDTLAGHVREGGFLSVFTEVLFVLALVFLAVAARRARHISAERLLGLSPSLVILAIAAVAFVVLGEEASWGQHWIGWSTPELFEGNVQNETNLHNFYTYRFEMAYYSVAVLAFIVLPYAWPAEPPRFLRGASLFVPPPMFAIMLLPVCGFMFYNWNYIFFGIWFFTAVLIALDIARRAGKTELVAATLVMAAMLVLSQLVFLARGHTLGWGHELTEVREFAIALGVLGYAVTLWSRVASLSKRAARADIGHAVPKAVHQA